MISICIPTIRPQNMPSLCLEIDINAGIPSGEYEIVTWEDTERIGCPAMLQKLVDGSNGDLVCFVGDDTMPEPDFLKNALESMESLPDGWGVVGLNSQKSRHAAHFLADKRMLDIMPDRMFFHTDYKHCWCDHELTDIAIEHGRFIFADNARLKHNHPVFNSAPLDADYCRVYSDEYKKHDKKTYFKRKRARYGKKLAIGFPLVDRNVSFDFMASFILMEKPDYTLLVPKFPVGEFQRDIAAVRNNLVEQALHDGCSHLLMMDTDQVYRTPGMVDRMLSHDAHVVGAPVHRRYPPFDAILLRGSVGKFKYIPDSEVYSGDLIDIDAIGTGCIMFRMDIFDEIEPPWFEIGTDAETGKTIGEDIGFCSKVKAAGFDIKADTSIEIGHLTQFEVNRNTYEMFCSIKGFRKTL